jgi:hypothetical protein
MRRRCLPFVLAILVAACALPTPSPSASPPPVQASPNPNLVELEARMDDAASRLGGLVRSLATASTGSPQELGLVAAQLDRFARDELAWIDEHPAEACFASALDAYRAAIADIATAADGFTALAGGPSPAPDEEARAAGQSLAGGTSRLEQAAALAGAARAACR